MKLPTSFFRRIVFSLIVLFGTESRSKLQPGEDNQVGCVFKLFVLYLGLRYHGFDGLYQTFQISESSGIHAFVEKTQ